MRKEKIKKNTSDSKFRVRLTLTDNQWLHIEHFNKISTFLKSLLNPICLPFRTADSIACDDAHDPQLSCGISTEWPGFQCIIEFSPLVRTTSHIASASSLCEHSINTHTNNKHSSSLNSTKLSQQQSFSRKWMLWNCYHRVVDQSEYTILTIMRFHNIKQSNQMGYQ